MKKYLLLIVLLISPLTVFATTKTETIYTNLDLNGKVIKSEVNSKLTNIESNYQDYTLLNKITNINGDEKFTLDNNRLTWESKGKDIYYKAPNTLEQPITIKTSYYLNNELVNVKDIKNKKGSIKIVIDLKNNSYNNTYGMYNPFVVSIATTLNNKNNKNISVTNGEIIDNGKTIAVAALASPGMYDNLKVEELKSLDQVIITYDTTKFEEKEIYAVATPKLLENIDISRLSKLDNLSSSLNLLQDNMNKIENGSNDLNNGVVKIKDGANAISSNLKPTVEGVNSLKDGADKLTNGINTLNDGLKAKMSEINSTYYDSEGNRIDPFADINQLISGDEQTLNKLETANKDFINLFNSLGLDINKDETDLNNDIMILVSNGSIDSNTMYTLIFSKKIYDLNNQNIYLYKLNVNGLTGMKNKLIDSSNTMTSLSSLISNTLNQLSSGSTELDNGLDKLGNGLDELYNGALQLSEGTNQLENGSITLTNGIKEFNNQGIKKLTSYSSIINNYSNKSKKLINMSNEYNGYSTNNANKTIFIYKIK